MNLSCIGTKIIFSIFTAKLRMLRRLGGTGLIDWYFTGRLFCCCAFVYVKSRSLVKREGVCIRCSDVSNKLPNSSLWAPPSHPPQVYILPQFVSCSDTDFKRGFPRFPILGFSEQPPGKWGSPALCEAATATATDAPAPCKKKQQPMILVLPQKSILMVHSCFADFDDQV